MKRPDTGNGKIVNDDNENDEEISIEVIKHRKKSAISSKSKCSKSNKELSNVPIQENKEPKDEELTHLESVLGDFHKLTDLYKFKSLTHLTLISQNIKDIELIINNIPVKENILFLCLNENEITNFKSVEKLINLQELHLNFNLIETITDNIKSLQNLTKLWLSENKISKIENLPINIQELWLAMNNVTTIPKDISQYEKLTFLNLAANLISDFEDIYNLQTIPKLTKLYLIDINFGDNPICQFLYYRNLIIHFLPNLINLDQIAITAEEKREINNFYSKKYLFNKNKIRHNHKISKMIFQLMKTNKLFITAVKLNQACFLSQRQKMLEYAKYEKEVLKVVNETKIEEIDKEITSSSQRLEKCLEYISTFESYFKYIKSYISEVNNLSIVSTFYEMETWGNCKIEPGNINSKWTKSCMDVIKSRIPESFYEKNTIKGIKFNKIFKLINKKSKILFDSVYAELIEQNGKFGEDKNYFDFYFMLSPKQNENYIDIINNVFEEKEIDNEIILTNSLFQIDEKIYGKNHNAKFFAVLCKCANFDSLMEKSNTSSLVNLTDYDSIKYELHKISSSKQVIQIIQEKKKFFLYKLKQIAIPEYIVEYEYEPLIQEQEQQKLQLNIENYFVSSFNSKITMDPEYENNFNKSAKHLFEKGNKKFLHEDLINKYSFIKFGEFNELDNSVLFLAKNSILTYLIKCFKYQNFDEYTNDIEKVHQKLNEITNVKFQRYFREIITNNKIKNMVQIDTITEVNLFNKELYDTGLKDFIKELKNKASTNEEFQNMLNNITKLVLCKTNINSINLSELVELFPNLKYLDLSHNNIKTISISNKELNYQIENIDLSFNTISNFNHISLLIETLPKLKEFSFFGNPLTKLHYSILLSSPKTYKVTTEFKEKINNLKNSFNSNFETQISISNNVNNNNIGIKHFDILFDCYSLGNTYQCFSSSKYFKETVNKESNYKSLMLSKRKLTQVPIVDSSQKDIQLLYINLNKIIQIENLTQFIELIELYIQNNKISKITNLPNTLVKLDISNNELQTLSGIEQAPKLKWLNIENNAIHSLNELNKLTNLVELYSAGNFISNEKECYSLKAIKCLEIVDLLGNEVCRNVHDIRLGMIFYCPKIKNFNRIAIDENERLKAKEYFTGRLTNEILEKKLGSQFNTLLLRELDLSSLKLKDEPGMFSKETYPQLTKLNLSKNLFKTFNIFGSLPSLIELNLNYNMITAIIIKNDKKPTKGISGLTHLESLELSGNSLSNLNGIQFLQALKILILRENNLNKIDAIHKMMQLTFLDISFNKLRNIDRTQLGYLPKLQILLCDNNFLRNVNAFAKLESLHTISFENNKIGDYFSLEKLESLANLRDLNVLNNPVTKMVNYRSRMLKLFEHLIKLDNTEVTSEEREMILLEMQMGDYYDETMMMLNNGLLANGPKIYPFNVPKQDKNLKKVNFVQLDFLHNNILVFPGNNDKINSPKNMISLPQIKPSPYSNVAPIKPPSSDSNKRNMHLHNNNNNNITNISSGNINPNIRGNSISNSIRTIPINYVLGGNVNQKRNTNHKDLYTFLGNNNTIGTELAVKAIPFYNNQKSLKKK